MENLSFKLAPSWSSKQQREVTRAVLQDPVSVGENAICRRQQHSDLVATQCSILYRYLSWPQLLLRTDPYKAAHLCAAGALPAPGGPEVRLLPQQASGTGVVPAVRLRDVLPGPSVPQRQRCRAGHPPACVSGQANEAICLRVNSPMLCTGMLQSEPEGCRQ